jgi:hypothetical protein
VKKILMISLLLLVISIAGSIVLNRSAERGAVMMKVGIPAALLIPFFPLAVYTRRTSSGSGYRENQSVLHEITASMELTNLYVGSIISNYNATDAVTIKLPAAEYGREVSFIKMTDQNFYVDPQDTEYIISPASGAVLDAGEVFELEHLYDTVTFRCLRTGYWSAINYVQPAENDESSLTVVAKTDDYQILSTDDNKVITNTGAAKDIVLTLPDGAVGLRHTILVTEAGYAITLDTPTGNYIKNPVTGAWQAATKYLKAMRVGSRITVTCEIADYWQIESMEGQWIAETTHVVSKTDDYTLLASDDGGVFDNTGAAKDIVLTMPGALPGMRYTAVVAEPGYSITLDPAAGDFLPDPRTGHLQAAAKYIKSGVLGANITLVCVLADYWQIESMEGLWIPETDCVNDKTANFDIEEEDNGKTYSNTGATGEITGTLPAAVPGLKFNFFVQAAQELRIDPDSTETIALPSTGVQGAEGKYLVADAAGEWVNLECLIAGQWEARGHGGTWTAEG